ncbi:MAG TPA: S9 family peptidase, partial [Tahibacter sp.]|nr:S9 family peptidase [Tahibacter sp.]
MSIRRLAAGLAMMMGAAGAQAEVPLADFARHVQYSSVKISPDGEYIAADAVVDNRRSLAIMRLSDMKATRITPRMDDIVSFTWVGKQRLMYTVGEPIGGFEFPVANG